MQIVLLVFVNIAMLAVFYLIISLKLERGASQFREQKMRRIMEEIMQEFNEISERNISLLENRIAVLKRLLEASGSLPHVDIRLDGAPAATEGERVSGAETGRRALTSGNGIASMNPPAIPSGDDRAGVGNELKKMAGFVYAGISRQVASFAEKVRKHQNDLMPDREEGPLPGRNAGVSVPAEKASECLEQEREISIDRSIDDKIAWPAVQPPETSQMLDEDGLLNLFKESHDKYSLINDLYGRGYPVDILAKTSGVPIGEVRLVLSLHGN